MPNINNQENKIFNNSNNWAENDLHKLFNNNYNYQINLIKHHISYKIKFKIN